MDLFSSYGLAIITSAVIILSFFFNQISKKTNIPSVLLLIGLGVVAQKLLDMMEIDISSITFKALELLGIVGLVMIVLEAALDLKLEKRKKPLLINSFAVGFLGLMATSFAIAYLLNYFIIPDFIKALTYAIPLSILSSAIIIPSVNSLVESKKEFMIYESTFSDILGIMFFYFLIGSLESETTGEIVIEVAGSITITVLISMIVSFTMVLLLQQLDSKVKLFFLMAILLLLYSIGKSLHLSSLLIIMVFGLVLNNYPIFFRGKKLKSMIKPEKMDRIIEDFHLVTMETAFVVRTFFFVFFGMTLDFSGIKDLNAVAIAVGILVLTYIIRYFFLKVIVRKNIIPQLWIAPRGLITVLLYFSIPEVLKDEGFNPTILLIVILGTSFIMTGALVRQKEDFEEKEVLEFEDWDALDEEIASLKKVEEDANKSMNGK